MIQAILYESNTGYTKRYAEALAKKTGLPLYTVAEARKNVAKGSAIVFLSWISGGSVVRLDKVKARFNIRAVGAVGLTPSSPEREASIVSHHQLGVPVFCLQGGFDMAKLHGMQKVTMQLTVRSLQMQKAANPDGAEDPLLQNIVNGCDYFDETTLEPLAAWIAAQQGANS